MANTNIDIDKELVEAVMKIYGFKTMKEAVNTTLKRSLDLFNNDELEIKNQIEIKKEELEKIAIDGEKIKTAYEDNLKDLKYEYECEKIILEKKQDQLEQELKLLISNLNEMKQNNQKYQETKKERDYDFEKLKSNYVYYKGDIDQYESKNNLYEMIVDFSEKYDVDFEKLIQELNNYI